MDSFEVLSIGIAVISIIIATFTLYQNGKMIESQTRPFMSVYIDKLNVSSTIYYLIIKNVGASVAKIDNISFPEELIKYTYSDRNTFKTAIGGSLSPGQKIMLHIDRSQLKNLYDNLPEVDFRISYSSTSKKYVEKFHVKLDMYKDELSLRASTKNNELAVLSYAAQEFLEKSL